MNPSSWSPGSIVSARGREWIVLSGSSEDALRLRPVTGSEEDATRVHPGLEPVRDARFPWPDAADLAGQDSALLLRDALLLSLRRGAGPLRSFGQIAVEPRAYQLVPLMMALRMDTVRLLIADDVGIGKTIEAALIARELFDRGEIERLTVLCPPHLVDQWCHELRERFHLSAVAVTASGAARLERELVQGVSLFEVHPVTVVSLDYIKSERRRDEFLRACPELVIVDEAHTCAATGAGRHQRYALLRGLADREDRHIVLLSATPHSGDDGAFYRLLGLLDTAFATIPDCAEAERNRLRNRLADHFVQRLRSNIPEWQERRGQSLFPRREVKELTYSLSGAWERFFTGVLEHCASVMRTGRRTHYWATLALLRCAASSPAAAALALRTRAGLEPDESLREALFDGDAASLPDEDLQPPAGVDDPAISALLDEAERLCGTAGDPKLKLLGDHLERQLQEGFSPVVFCRYIATAHYLTRHLRARLPRVEVQAITGELTPDERREAVDRLGAAERRLLVATDCLSEGINLQEHFNAVVHYDLSWNPTRHEQREGRVDRFGQKSPVVRATLMYGANNPVDGVVLEVILRKAERIRKELGVPVPLPDEGHTLTEALVRAILLRGGTAPRQETLAFMGPLDAARALDAAWTDAAARARGSATLFAQRTLKPEDVMPEWHRALAAVGGAEAARRFVGRALSRAGAGLEESGAGFRAPLDRLPEALRERLDAEELRGVLRIDFEQPPAPGCRFVHRSHPLVSVLAETLLSRTLAGVPDPMRAGRAGCWMTAAVEVRTVVALFRLRHRIVQHKARRTAVLLVEEAAGIAWTGAQLSPLCEGDAALELLRAPPVGDPPPPVRERQVRAALQQLAERQDALDAFSERRAAALLSDHERLRESARARGRAEVQALRPPDLVGLYVLLPEVRT